MAAEQRAERPHPEVSMFVAKLIGAVPRGERDPIETKEFSTQGAGIEWLTGQGLKDFPWPISRAELFAADGKSVWREWHWSHPALKAKNEDYWRKKDPGREEREREKAERKRKIASGLIRPEDLSLAERFELEKPAVDGASLRMASGLHSGSRKDMAAALLDASHRTMFREQDAVFSTTNDRGQSPLRVWPKCRPKSCPRR